MKIKHAIFLAALFVAFGLEAKEGQPNVLILIADQWREQAFGYTGNPDVKTPNIDRLAGESVDFKNAVAGVPVCCPTRASLFTGQYATTHGVFLNDVPLAPDAKSLAKAMKGAGYDTGYVGKWHLNGDGRSAFIPKERRQGFDYWKVLECTHDYNNSFYYGDTPEKLKWEGYDAIAQTRDVQKYLQARSTNDAPFLFVLAWGPPHNPYESAPAKYKAMYDPAKLTLRGNVPAESAVAARKDLAGYYAHCTALDDCVGDLLKTLRDSGLDKDTIVIFTADHGDMLGSHGQIRKQRPWDESIRIPFLLRWPAKLPARKVDAVIDSEDVMPTLLGLCQVTKPDSVEGLDYSRFLFGSGKNPSDGAALISCVAPFGEWTRKGGGREMRGIRTPRFTYVRDLNGPWLLYDDESDPLQMTNVVNHANMANIQRTLQVMLERHLQKAHDQFLPGEDYVKKWGYKVDANGTVPYTH